MSLAHTCDALLLTCMDWRLHPALENVLRIKGFTFDPFTSAGAAKNLVNPEKPEDRDFILRQIAKSQKLHHIEKVILVNHTDCGGYGGSGAFLTREAEKRKQWDDLKAAAQIVKENFLDLEVITILACLSEGEGEWKVELEEL